MPNEVFEFLHNKTCIIGGLSGIFKHLQRKVIYPYEHTIEKLEFIPDKESRQSEEYLKVKRQLGDDWDMDLTCGIDLYCQAAEGLGYDFPRL